MEQNGGVGKDLERLGEVLEGRAVDLGEGDVELGQVSVLGQFFEDGGELLAVGAGGGVEVDESERGVVGSEMVVVGIDLGDCGGSHSQQQGQQQVSGKLTHLANVELITNYNPT